MKIFIVFCRRKSIANRCSFRFVRSLTEKEIVEMAFKPPHSELSKLVASPKRHAEMNRENRSARQAYEHGKHFERGRKDSR